MEEFQQQPGEHVSNMAIEALPENEETTMAWILDELKDLPHEEYTEFVGNACIKAYDARSRLEKALCKGHVESRIKEMRKLSGKMQSNVIYGLTAREMGHVQSPDVFKSTW